MIRADIAIWTARHHLMKGGDRRLVRALEQMQSAVLDLMGGVPWNGSTN